MDGTGFRFAAAAIKEAIVRSRYRAATLVNKELLSLYYAVGKYVSDNSRLGAWGQGAIRQLSDSLQRELPGLRGFSEASIKRMRLFYDGWQPVIAPDEASPILIGECHVDDSHAQASSIETLTNRPLTMDDLTTDGPDGESHQLIDESHDYDSHAQASIIEILTNRPLSMDDLKTGQIMQFQQTDNRQDLVIEMQQTDQVIDLDLLSNHLRDFEMPGFSYNEFTRLGFTHHSEILAKEKSLDGRLFYIAQCAAEFWSVEALKSNLRGQLYSKSGTMPSNFFNALPEPEQARRAMRAFKDEYLLDFINIEDENDPSERLIEHGITANIKQFILSFGNGFCFIGNQHRVVVDEKEFFIDLLFFNRRLRCLVAIDLKRGDFKPEYLGKMNFYLSALDEYVRHDDEAPSIGIILCKEANRNIVEFAVRDYTKPMGVATYRTRNEMPEAWKKALPDFDDMKKLLDSDPKGQDGHSGAGE